MKIATLTLNPAIDRTIYCGKIKTGALNRAVSPSVMTHGGKGTNVSCVLKTLGVESTAYGFYGGDTGDLFMKLLEPYNINTDFTRVKSSTRMNIKIIAEDGESTEFNEAGGLVEPSEIKNLLEKIRRDLDGIDFFFMSGSVPPGIGKEIYRDIIDLGDRTKFILDCDGEALKLCMSNKKKPYMIKPNQFELEQYCGKKFDLVGTPYMASGNFAITSGDGHDISCPYEKIPAIIEVKEAEKKIFDETGVTVLCTLGEYGGIYCGVDGICYAAAPRLEKHEIRGFAGAGDTFLPAFVAAHWGMMPSNGASGKPRPTGGSSSAERALTFAVAAATAKVTKPGTEMASPEEIAEMTARIGK